MLNSFYLISSNNDNKLWQKYDKFWELTKTIKTTITDEYNEIFVITLYKGFRTDGLSVPKVFQWFLPQWDNKHPTYNLAGIIHDALYTRKGFYLLSREECDSVLRGLMRDSGISRFKAGCADKAVEWFAGGKRHWGNDDFDNFDLISMA